MDPTFQKKYVPASSMVVAGDILEIQSLKFFSKLPVYTKKKSDNNVLFLHYLNLLSLCDILTKYSLDY